MQSLVAIAPDQSDSWYYPLSLLANAFLYDVNRSFYAIPGNQHFR